MVQFAEALKDVVGALYIDHDETHEDIRKLQRIMQHPNDLKKLTLIVNELGKVDEEEHGEIDPVEEDDQAHVGLVTLEFEIV